MEPQVRGPYKNSKIRDGAAIKLHRKMDPDENKFFALDIYEDSGDVEAWTYCSGFFEEE